MQTPSGEHARTLAPGFDDLSVEEFRKLMSENRRRRAALHSRRSSGRPIRQSPGVRLVAPSEDPIDDLNRKFDALAAYLISRMAGSPDATPTAQQVAQLPTEGDAAAPPEWLAEYLTKQNAKLVRALWGKGEVSQKEVWLQVWKRKDSVIRETIESAVKRTNRQLAELPAAITSTYHIGWHQKKLRLVEVDGQGFKSEPNEPRTVND